MIRAFYADYWQNTLKSLICWPLKTSFILCLPNLFCSSSLIFRLGVVHFAGCQSTGRQASLIRPPHTDLFLRISFEKSTVYKIEKIKTDPMFISWMLSVFKFKMLIWFLLILGDFFVLQIFVVLLSRALFSVGATLYLSKSWQRFFFKCGQVVLYKL